MAHSLLPFTIAVLVLQVAGAQDQRQETSLSKLYKTAGESHEKYQTQQVPVVPPIQNSAYQGGSYQAPSTYQGNSYQAPTGYQSPTYQTPLAYQSPGYQTPSAYQNAPYQVPASTTTVCIEVRTTPHSQSPTTTLCGPQVSPHPIVSHGYKEVEDSYKEADDSYKEADPGPHRVYPVMPVQTAVIPQSYAVHTIHPSPVLYHDVHPAIYSTPYYGQHLRSSDEPRQPPRSSYDSSPNLPPPPVYTSSDSSYPPLSYQTSYPLPSAPFETTHYTPTNNQPLVFNCQVQPAPVSQYSSGRTADGREVEPTDDVYVVPSSRYATPDDVYMPRMPTDEPRATPCLFESQPRVALIDPMYTRAADLPMLPPLMMPLFQPVRMGNQPMSKSQIRQHQLLASEQRLAELKSRLAQNTQRLTSQQQPPYQTTSQPQQPYQPTSQQQPPYQPTSQQPLPQQQPSYQPTLQQQPPQSPPQQQPIGAEDADTPRAAGLSPLSSSSGQGGPSQQSSQEAPSPPPKPNTALANQPPKKALV